MIKQRGLTIEGKYEGRRGKGIEGFQEGGFEEGRNALKPQTPGKASNRPSAALEPKIR